MSDDWTEADEIIEEVREIRRRMWAQFDNDPKKLIAHFIEHDKHLTGPTVPPPQRKLKHIPSRD
jgi:hypothetical protein